MSKCPDFPFRFIIGSQTETDGRKHPLAGRVYMYLTSRITGGLSAPRSVSGFLGSGGIPGEQVSAPSDELTACAYLRIQDRHQKNGGILAVPLVEV